VPVRGKGLRFEEENLMADMTDSDRQRGRDAVAQALLSGDSGAAEAEAMDFAGGDLKALFCSNWDTVKSVLQFEKDFLPALVRPVIAIIIKAGDALHAAIC
jgi:hypothetical protein